MASKGNGGGNGGSNRDWSPQDDYPIYLNSVGNRSPNYESKLESTFFTYAVYGSDLEYNSDKLSLTSGSNNENLQTDINNRNRLVTGVIDNSTQDKNLNTQAKNLLKEGQEIAKTLQEIGKIREKYYSGTTRQRRQYDQQLSDLADSMDIAGYSERYSQLRENYLNSESTTPVNVNTSPRRILDDSDYIWL